MPAPNYPSRLVTAVGTFDQGVGRFFDQHLRGQAAVDRVMYGASAVGDHSLIWSILAVAQALRRSDDPASTARLARVITGLAVESAVVNGPVKWIFRRARPAPAGLRPHPLRTPRSSSFPSGHATSAFFGAALLSQDDPLWPLYYAIAVVVALSRVHVDIHHASDVVAGIAVGAAMGQIGRRLMPLPPAGTT
jgi:undecaprenyl-diphosphatase